MKTDFNKILIIILASFAVGLTYNFFSPKGIPIIGKEIEVITDSVNFNEGTETSQSEIRGLTTEQVYEIYNNREGKFVDGRDSWDFAEGHIPGAVNIPEYKFTPEDPGLKFLDKNDKIIVYCEGDQCDVSKRLAAELMKLGYKKVWVYLGGWKEWWEYKFPVEKE